MYTIVASSCQTPPSRNQGNMLPYTTPIVTFRAQYFCQVGEGICPCCTFLSGDCWWQVTPLPPHVKRNWQFMRYWNVHETEVTLPIRSNKHDHKFAHVFSAYVQVETQNHPTMHVKYLCCIETTAPMHIYIYIYIKIYSERPTFRTPNGPRRRPKNCVVQKPMHVFSCPQGLKSPQQCPK